MRNNVPYVRMRNAAKQRPLLCVFVGTFMAISAIPLIIFLLFVIGSVSIGLVTFTAVQGSIILIAFAFLCACLVLPLILSGIFAILGCCGLTAVKTIIRESRERHPLAGPFGMLSSLSERVRSLSNINLLRANHYGGLGGESAGQLVQVVYNLLGNRAIGTTSHINQSGSRRLVQLVQMIDSGNNDSFPVLSQPQQDMDQNEPNFHFLTNPSRVTYTDTRPYIRDNRWMAVNQKDSLD